MGIIFENMILKNGISFVFSFYWIGLNLELLLKDKMKMMREEEAQRRGRNG